jgi:hypothetical protein
MRYKTMMGIKKTVGVTMSHAKWGMGLNKYLKLPYGLSRDMMCDTVTPTERFYV